MIEFKFTTRSVNALVCPDKRTTYSDTQIKDLKLRHTPSGNKVFYFRKKQHKKTE